MQKGLLFVISGPSGTGKGTVCKQVIKEQDIEVSVSMTTRKPREGEIEGVSYFFVSHEQFLKKLEEGGLLEYAEVYGNYYGTPKAKVLERLEAGQDVILEIDIQGALNVKKVFPDAVLIFLLPPSLDELRNRIVSRGTETEEAIRLRLGETMKEIKFLAQYDYCIVNDSLTEAVRNVNAVICAEHLKIGDNAADIIEGYKKNV